MQKIGSGAVGKVRLVRKWVVGECDSSIVGYRHNETLALPRASR